MKYWVGILAEGYHIDIKDKIKHKDRDDAFTKMRIKEPESHEVLCPNRDNDTMSWVLIKTNAKELITLIIECRDKFKHHVWSMTVLSAALGTFLRITEADKAVIPNTDKLVF